MLRREGHEIHGMHVNKISLSPFDSKRWIAEDGIHTHTYGYNPTAKEADLLAAEEYLQWVNWGVTVCLEGQRAVLHARSRAWGRHANSREQAHWVW